jgi:hypothetical protein
VGGRGGAWGGWGWGGGGRASWRSSDDPNPCFRPPPQPPTHAPTRPLSRPPRVKARQAQLLGNEPPKLLPPSNADRGVKLSLRGPAAEAAAAAAAGGGGGGAGGTGGTPAPRSKL